MDCPVLVVPGIGNSGPMHWQSLWQQTRPEWHRLQVDNWDHVVRDDWVSAIEREVVSLGKDTVLVAHSLGCLAVVHWAAQHAPRIRGALLVAVPDPAGPAFPATAAFGFSPLPLTRLPFPTTIVASSDDPYGSIAYSRSYADAWGSDFVDMGARGHLNADSALGDWPEGYRLLQGIGA
ncbi:RBBP9/YdeN family alpha/beta hydrolase [Collimonas silvisoli]|uniref:RBBP9/YdeN family alpha/beta hydrolase n=1 Tax=Collimonas silvisoli TaxID=2825884 RepID=UPI001B8CFE20|nr:alpha/beta hydrolase [Collimonas silvisoli]